MGRVIKSFLLFQWFSCFLLLPPICRGTLGRRLIDDPSQSVSALSPRSPLVSLVFLSSSRPPPASPAAPSLLLLYMCNLSPSQTPLPPSPNIPCTNDVYVYLCCSVNAPDGERPRRCGMRKLVFLDPASHGLWCPVHGRGGRALLWLRLRTHRQEFYDGRLAGLSGRELGGSNRRYPQCGVRGSY